MEGANRNFLNVSDLFKAYSHKVRAIPRIGAEEEAALFKALEGGDMKARERIFSGNLGFVLFYLREKRRPRQGSAELLDYVQEGSIALLHAMEKFDYRKGVRLATYAAQWVRQAVSHAEAEEGWAFRLPANVAADVRLMAREKAALERSLGRKPTDEELAANLDWTASRLKTAQKAGEGIVKLDAPVKGEEDLRFMDLQADYRTVDSAEQAIRAMWKIETRAAVASLPARERKVIRLRYGLDGREPLGLAETGKRCGVSHQRVSQIEKRAISRIRQSGYMKRLEGYAAI